MMENLTSQLTRTCIACGIEKPLSAFLQLDKQGTSYGKVCAKCRSQGKTGKPAPATTDDERGTAPSGIGIRGKEKIYIDTKREQKIHSLKELYKKEDIKKQDALDDKTKRTLFKEDSEKKHREFLDSKKQAETSDKKTKANEQIIAGQQNQKTRDIQSGSEQYQTTLETKKKQDVETVKVIEKEEIQKTTTDFNNLFSGLDAKSERHSETVKRFFTWLGSSAPIVQTLKHELGLQKETVSESNKNTTNPSRRGSK